MDLIVTLKERNSTLFWFGLLNLVVVILLLILSVVKPVEYAQTNAWYKPIKFALSTAIVSWSIAWYCGYINIKSDLTICIWVIILNLGFEVFYIALQAAKGEPSHYNQTTHLHSIMFSIMAMAAAVATIAIGYIGSRFFITIFPGLPDYYMWAIRFGFILFVIFSFEGFVMGGRMSHTVGGADGSRGIPFLNWSLSFGDLRVAHFVGMHALQILPLLAWYILKDFKLVVISSILYGLLAVFVLVQALRGNSIIHL